MYFFPAEVMRREDPAQYSLLYVTVRLLSMGLKRKQRQIFDSYLFKHDSDGGCLS